jgi:hypothetical protein
MVTRRRTATSLTLGEEKKKIRQGEAATLTMD